MNPIVSRSSETRRLSEERKKQAGKAGLWKDIIAKGGESRWTKKEGNEFSGEIIASFLPSGRVTELVQGVSRSKEKQGSNSKYLVVNIFSMNF